MSDSRPNLLLLFTDQFRADAIGALGHDIVRTPQLDRLVREGTSFTNAFSPCPVCVPARCCTHYGLYPQKTGLFDNGVMMEDNGASYAALLTDAGYRTHSIGKCHFTPDRLAQRGYQTRETQEEATSDPAVDDYLSWLQANGYDDYEPHGARGEMYYIPQVSTLPAQAHPTHWVGSQSKKFITEASQEEAPWMLFASFVHPHPPIAPPKPWHKLYRTKDMPEPFLPENRKSLQTWINRFQNRYKYRDRGLDMQLLRTLMAYYYASVSFIDYQVGRILESLEEAGQLDNTLILFTADHGEYLGDYGCFGKRGMHDVSSRVPMLARLPGRFAEGHRCETATSLVDLFPTMTTAAGIDTTGMTLDGTDLAEVATSGTPDRMVISQFGELDRRLHMAVTQEAKYVYSAGEGTEFFFDRHHDPREGENLAVQESPPAEVGNLKERLLSYLEAEGASDAVERVGGALAWRSQPPLDESYLDDPDAHLLIQDYPTYGMSVPGYE